MWMDSDVKSDDDWISKLKNSPNFDKFVVDGTKGSSSGKPDWCYTITSNTNGSTPPLAFNSEDCDKKAFPICVIERKSVYPGQPIPKFPCVKTSKLSREKRSSGANLDDGQKGGKQLSNVCEMPASTFNRIFYPYNLM